MGNRGWSSLLRIVLATVLLLLLTGCAGFWVNPSLTAIAVTPLTPTITAETGTPPTCPSGSVCTVQMSATGTFSDGTTAPVTASWSTSNATIATVNSSTGLVTGVGAGTATITAASGTVTGSTSVTVTLANLQSIQISPGSTTVALGTGSLQFHATGTFAGGGMQDITGSVTWTSSNTGVATISNTSGTNGLATLVAAGATNITATSGAISSPASTLTVN